MLAAPSSLILLELRSRLNFLKFLIYVKECNILVVPPFSISLLPISKLRSARFFRANSAWAINTAPCYKILFDLKSKLS